MNPTPEQVAQWAHEAGFNWPEISVTTIEQRLHRLVARAMAEQAEADAKLCGAAFKEHGVHSNFICATDIRANAPKVTT